MSSLNVIATHWQWHWVRLHEHDCSTSSEEAMRTNRYCGGASFFVKGASKRWYFMPISGWQWAAAMNDGPYNWCAQHSAWGSWISGLEHTAKLICFVKDGGRGEGRLLSFRQEPSTWCQERRRCSSCCLCCNPHHPITVKHPSPPRRHQSTHQHMCFGVCVRVCAYQWPTPTE